MSCPLTLSKRATRGASVYPSSTFTAVDINDVLLWVELEAKWVFFFRPTDANCALIYSEGSHHKIPLLLNFYDYLNVFYCDLW